MAKHPKCKGCPRPSIKTPLKTCSVCGRELPRTKAQIGRGSRNKGNAYENQVCKKLSKWWGEDKSFMRTPSSGGWSRIKAPGDIVTPETFPFELECKKVEGWELVQLIKSDKSILDEYWEQTIEECRDSRKPWMVFSRNHQPDFIMMYTRTFNRLVEVSGDGLLDCPRFKLQRDKAETGRIVMLLDDMLDKLDPEVFGCLTS